MGPEANGVRLGAADDGTADCGGGYAAD